MHIITDSTTRPRPSAPTSHAKQTTLGRALGAVVAIWLVLAILAVASVALAAAMAAILPL